MAKPGLDGHDRGIKVLAAAYRDAGMDVIYLGLRQTPESVVKVSIQEGVDVIALSILSGAHMTIFTKVMELIKENNLSNVLVTGGGIIPEEDADKLSSIGVGKLFGPGFPADPLGLRAAPEEHRDAHLRPATSDGSRSGQAEARGSRDPDEMSSSKGTSLE